MFWLQIAQSISNSFHLGLCRWGVQMQRSPLTETIFVSLQVGLSTRLCLPDPTDVIIKGGR